MAPPATLEPPTTEISETPPRRNGQALPNVDWPYILSLYVQGVPVPDISKETGVKPSTIYKRAVRGKWTQVKERSRRLASLAPIKRQGLAVVVQTGPQNALQSSSNRVRSDFASVLEQATTALLKSPINEPGELPNTPERQGKAAVIKTLVDAAATVFDWSAQRNQGVVVFEQSTLQDEPAIDVQSVPEPTKPPTPEPQAPAS